MGLAGSPRASNEDLHALPGSNDLRVAGSGGMVRLHRLRAIRVSNAQVTATQHWRKLSVPMPVPVARFSEARVLDYVS